MTPQGIPLTVRGQRPAAKSSPGDAQGIPCLPRLPLPLNKGLAEPLRAFALYRFLFKSGQFWLSCGQLVFLGSNERPGILAKADGGFAFSSFYFPLAAQ